MMDVSLQQIFQTAQVDDLKALGKFLEIKRFVEAQLYLKLGAKGWNSLLLKLKAIRALEKSSCEYEDYFCTTPSYPVARANAAKMIGFEITAKNWTELKDALHGISTCVTPRELDLHERFEKKKRKNFMNSSRLEGIEIPAFDEKLSLERILAKHGRQLNG
ncbi:hypothetical protein AO265_22775 [Pseudomonas sp. ABAC61]|nr:hypothetical protein AO265_22775 [Pseudomonas sp. ABAC61]